MTFDLHACLHPLLAAAPAAEPVASVADWIPRWRALVATGLDPLALALRGGFAADRAAWAFACGYQAALRAQLPPPPGAAELLSLCVTEPAGNRPRDIATRRGADGRLHGHKRWSTLAPVADRLLVIASAAETAGAAARPRLQAWWVRRDAAGVQLRTMDATPFVPEVPHAEIHFDGVLLADADRVAGDAYTRFVKPFRSAEDLYVAAAVLAWLLREARAGHWPAAFVERCAAQIAALAALAPLPADAASTQVALAGALAGAAQLHDDASALWSAAGGEGAARWLRDRPLMAVAGAARRMRAERAWQRLQVRDPAGEQDRSASPAEGRDDVGDRSGDGSRC